jgi:CoA:oxalate CoA-transferase
MNKPFKDILVADFSHVLSGPFAAMTLCDLGARVIKIERAGTGDDSRQFGPFKDNHSLYFESVNRGKESIGLNLKDPNDKQVALNIIKKADILIENFRPGTMKKLGLDYEILKKINPRIIYASVSGFGQTGTMSNLPAYDALIQAMSGFMSVTGDPNGAPTKAGPSIADMLAGVYCFSAITTALYQREKTGEGCQVDISMFDCMIAFLESDVVMDKELHKVAERIGNRHPNIAPFNSYQCKDDLLVICAGTDKLFQSACEVMELKKLANHPDFQSNVDRLKNHVKLKPQFDKALQKDYAKNWYEKFVKAGVPAGLVNNVDQALKLVAVKERDMIITTGEYDLPGCPIKLSTLKETGKRKPAPKINQDNDKVRKEFE